MNFQGALQSLAGAFLAFYIACMAVGRPDIPLKLVTELRVRALAGTQASWGCPSIFNHRDACHSYDPRRYHR